MAYTKLHQSLVTSTIWREPSPTRIVWVTLMAIADKNGEVQASIPGLADLCRVTLEECEAALSSFLSPDKYSRTKTLEGRRIQEIQGGWFLINHPQYRAMASREDETQKASERMARHRRNKAQQSVTVTESLHIAEAEAEAEAEKGNIQATVAVALTLSSDEPAKPKLVKRGPIARNELLDAFAEACGCNPRLVTPKAWPQFGVALAEIKAVCPEVTAAELNRHAENYVTHMSKAMLTPMALAKHWALSDKPNPRAPKPAHESEYADAFEPDFQQYPNNNNNPATK